MPSRSGAGTGASPRAWALRLLGEWCARHFVVVVAWLVALVVLQLVSRAVGGRYSDDFTLSDSPSHKGIEVLQRHDPQAGGYSSQIVLHDGRQELTALGTQMSTTVGSLERLPHVLSAQNPLTAQDASTASSGQPDAGPLSTDGGRPTSRSVSTSSPPASTTATSTGSTTRWSPCGRGAHRSSTAGHSVNWPGRRQTTG